jgi:hypothetical protein
MACREGRPPPMCGMSQREHVDQIVELALTDSLLGGAANGPGGCRELSGNRDCKDRISAGLRAVSHLAERQAPLDRVAVRSCDDAV